MKAGELSGCDTYGGVGGLLLLVSLLVGGGLLLVGLALLLGEGLPLLAKNLADLAYGDKLVSEEVKKRRSTSEREGGGCIPNLMPGFSVRTFSRCSLAKNM